MASRCSTDGLSNRYMVHSHRYLKHLHFSFIHTAIACMILICFLYCLESFTGFLLVLRNHGDLNHRGPLFILVIWIALAMLSGIWLRSAISAGSWQNAAVLVVLHAIYLLSLILKGQSTYIQRRALDNDVSN